MHYITLTYKVFHCLCNFITGQGMPRVCFHFYMTMHSHAVHGQTWAYLKMIFL